MYSTIGMHVQHNGCVQHDKLCQIVMQHSILGELSEEKL